MRIDKDRIKEVKAMPLHVKSWCSRMFGSWGHLLYLPFDKDFSIVGLTPQYNRMPLSRVGRQPRWYIFVEFPELDPQDPSYPHYVEFHDNEDFATIKFDAKWSVKAGTQGGRAPVPTDVGKHRVRLVLLNRDQKPLLSQSGDYYIDAG